MEGCLDPLSMAITKHLRPGNLQRVEVYIWVVVLEAVKTNSALAQRQLGAAEVMETQANTLGWSLFPFLGIC